MKIYQTKVVKRLKPSVPSVVLDAFPSEIHIIAEYSSESSMSGNNTTYIAIDDEGETRFFYCEVINEFYE